MRIPQPLTIAAAAILGIYAGSLGAAYGLARVLLTDRHGRRCGQAHRHAMCQYRVPVDTHDCDLEFDAWSGWGPCVSCGSQRVCCRVCSEDLTPHADDCNAGDY